MALYKETKDFTYEDFENLSSDISAFEINNEFFFCSGVYMDGDDSFIVGLAEDGTREDFTLDEIREANTTLYKFEKINIYEDDEIPF